MKTKWIKGAISTAALGGLIWLLARIGWTEVGLRISQVGFSGFALLFVTGMAEASFDGAALNRAASRRVGFFKSLLINQEGAALNLLIPGEAGEMFKARLLAKDLPSREATSAVVVWNLAFRTAKSIVIFTAAAAALAGMPSQQGAIWAIGLAGLNLAFTLLLGIVLQRRWTGRLLSVIKISFLQGLIAHLREAEERAASFSKQRQRDFAAIVTLQVGARLSGFGTLFFALRFLGLSYQLPLCLLVYALTELATYAIALLPTKIGTTEGSTYLIFDFLKLSGPSGAILQVVLRIKQLIQVAFFLITGFATQFRKADPAPVASNSHAAT